MTGFAELLGLFVVALGAASLLPLQSEPALVGLLLLGESPAWLLVAVASLGNTIGSAINWWLGRQAARWRDRPWFPVAPDRLDRAIGWYRRWGRWSLLLSWAPVIGDPLTLVAGVLREPLGTFLLLVALAKTARYLLLTWTTLALA